MKTRSHQTPVALDQDEALLNAVIDNFDGYVWSIDRNHHTLLLNSRLIDAIRREFGTKARYGEKIYNLLENLDPGLSQKWIKLYDIAFKGESHRTIHEFEHKGHPVILELSINPIVEGDEVTRLACFARNVTKETLAKRHFQAIQKRFRTLIENSHDGIALLDTAGIAHYIAPSIHRILGYHAEDLVGVETMMLIHEEDVDRLRITREKLSLHPGKSDELTYRVRHKNGEWRWICSTLTNMLHEPSVNALVCNYKDVTERVLAQQAIQNSEELYRSLFNNSPASIWVCDRERLAYLEVNHTALENYGYTREEFLSMTAFDLRTPNNREDLVRISREGVCADFNHKIRRHLKKNGDITFVEIAVHPIIYKDIDAYLVIAHDISETLRLQHELMKERVNRQVEITRATIEAQEKERAEMGTELHDNVNQMLATVKLYLAAYHTGAYRDDELLARSRHIVDDCIGEIRKISQSLVPPSLGELTLKESLEQLTLALRLAKKNIKLSVINFREDELRESVKISLYRIVQEQINNILKHSKATKVQISLQHDAERLLLRITDNGIGFDPADKKKGIGIRNMINRATTFNGNLEIISSPGNGCTIEVSFKV